MRLVSFFTRHATAANLLVMLAIAFGVFAAGQIRSQYLPDVVTETVSVSIDWDDASAEEVSRDIVGVVSPNLLSVEGLSELSAFAREGKAGFTLTFEPGRDMSTAVEDVEEAMPSSSSLPDEADDAEVSRGDWSEKVFDVVISGDYPQARMEEIGEALESKLLREGITDISLHGITDPEITVEIEAGRLAEYGLTLSDLADMISDSARGTSVGEIDASSSPVQVGQERLSLEGVQGMSISTDEGVVDLKDIVDFQVAEAGSDRAYFLESKPAIVIGVDRGAGGDSLKIQDHTLQVVNEFIEDRPEVLQVDLMRNEAADIEARLGLLVDNAVFGLILVVVLLFFFLSPSAAIWVSAGIPVSMAAGIGLMWVSGQSLNMISTIALLICLGIIVDDAIVVAENAEHRRRNLGERPAQAAERAARKMLAPILASTVTTVVAFLSLDSIGGDFGDFISTVPLVVIAVLIASLIECFLVLPHHLGHGLAWMDKGVMMLPSQKVNQIFDYLRERAFKPLVRGIVSMRYAVLLVVIGLTLQSATMLLNRDVSWRFFDSPQDPTISANIAMRDEATREDTVAMLDELVRAAEAAAADFEDEYGKNPIESILTEIGGSAGPGLATEDDKDEDLLGALTIEIIDGDERPYEVETFVKAFQSEMIKPDLLETFSFRSLRRGPGGDSLDIALFGYDANELDLAAEELKTQLEEIPEVTALEDDLSMGVATQVLSLTNMGRAMGFDEADVAEELKARLSGVEATTFQDGTQTATIQVELPEGDITDAFLEDIMLQSPDGRWVELGEIVDVATDPTIKAIRSQSGMAVVRITGEISSEDDQRAEDVLTQIQDDIMPKFVAEHGMSFEMMGLTQQEDEFLTGALVGYGICLLLIYMTLALVLGHWFRPLSIMAVIPAGLTGVIWGHYWWGISMSIFSVVGFVGMSGIIVNDSIVLVTAIIERMKTLPSHQAIIEATAERLRPVLLTTLTTVVGLAPLLFETSSQAEFLKPLVVTLCFGLGVGFFVVLLVVPALLAIQEDILNLVRRLFRLRSHAWSKAQA